MRREHSPKIRKSRFEPTPLGYLRRSRRSGQKLARSSWIKWRPIILQVEELRQMMFNGQLWSEVHAEDIAFELMPALYARCRGRGGSKPRDNTLRGRYDACNSYFTFLTTIAALEQNPLDYLVRPSSTPADQPFLEPSEDAALAAVEKNGHELAVYALARGLALREEEICELEDTDVDLANGVVRIRKGKTQKAMRRVPISATAHVLRHALGSPRRSGEPRRLSASERRLLASEPGRF